MKNPLLKFAAFLLILAGVATTCNPPEIEYPKEISVTEYALNSTLYQWANLPYDEKVIVINNEEEFNNYIFCTGSSYPVVDFSKHSILLISGYVNGIVAEKNVQDFKQVSSTKYILNVELGLNYKDNTDPWNMAIIVEKLNDDSRIKLNLSLKTPKIIQPVEITDFKILSFFETAHHPLWGISCFVTGKDTCILINSISEFQQAYVCIAKLPEIDFDKFTLVIGEKSVASESILLTEQKIAENNNLTLLITVYGVGHGLASGLRHYWGIYPKLPNKPFYIEYKYLYQ